MIETTALLTISAVIIAYFLDWVFGDPVKLPHPIVYFGKAISAFEKKLNKGSNRLLKGALSSILLILCVFGIFFLLSKWFLHISPYAYLAFTSIFFFYGIANRTLIKEGRDVFKVLERDGLIAGRQQLSRIVGRDTSQLNEQQIRKAALETMAENLSDGVVAPIFWFALLGIPGMMAYKMINTLDSMIGYKNERYILYGRIAAYIDDVANYLPARITAFFMAIAGLSGLALQFIFKYGHQHSSPNAGYPESALAGILNVRFGGPNIYHGQLFKKPFIGLNERNLVYKDVQITARINHIVCLMCILITTIINFYLK
ncbi:MAG: adenosylcobinamide-phosphate synthase CbiB [Carboxylicivirga sp.]|jgi:adenosylcobinamide-phosphate synthase|nr:adenosylcobinamide-phosphate synthase CbiB [Carboxylicivirga sp.]